MPPADLPRHHLTGVCPPARAAVLAALLRAHPAPVWLVVVEELRTAEQLAEDLVFFHGLPADAVPLEVRIFPESLADSRDPREAFLASSDRLTEPRGPKTGQQLADPPHHSLPSQLGRGLWERRRRS